MISCPEYSRLVALVAAAAVFLPFAPVYALDDLDEWDAEKLDDWGLDLPVDLSVQEELESEEDNYEIPNEINTDIVIGDLFEIGEHRLLCGDSTDIEKVELLMNGQEVNLLTDPPYGINANKQTLGTGKKRFHRGDNWDIEVPDFYYILALVNKAIIWGGNYFADKLPINNDWLCWHKKNDGLSFSEFELAWTNLGKNCRMLAHHWGGEHHQPSGVVSFTGPAQVTNTNRAAVTDANSPRVCVANSLRSCTAARAIAIAMQPTLRAVRYSSPAIALACRCKPCSTIYI